MQRFAPLVLLLLAAGCEEPPLAGTLVYEPDVPEGRQVTDAEMDSLVAAFRQRVRTTSPRPLVDVLPGRRIAIAVYGEGLVNLDRVERIVESLGTLEFRILANRQDHADIIEQAEEKQADQVLDPNGDLLAWWVPLAKGKGKYLVDDPDLAVRETGVDGATRTEVLVVEDPYDVTGMYLTQAITGRDQTGHPCIRFTLSSRGGVRFNGLTSENLPDEATGFTRKLGIILDGRLDSAPAIRSTIGAQGEITGDFTREEVEELVAVLGAGSLPVPIKQIDRIEPAGE
jgi:SecD/SecF fusion protein